MSRDDLPNRIVDQFSYRDQRADIWRALDLVVATDRHLNLGYSRWYQTHLLGCAQQRLVERIAAELTPRLAEGDKRLLDVGCGRGGGTAILAETLDVDVVGVDLVSYNVTVARENAPQREGSPEFVVGDATRLPFRPSAFTAVTAIDAIVYVPDVRAVFDQIARVLRPDGVCVISDLLAADGSNPRGSTLQKFSSSWDMPTLRTIAEYRATIDRVGLRCVGELDVSSNSIARFRKWTALYLRLVDSELRELLFRAFERHGLDPETITAQIRTAHEALPALRHRLFVLEAPS